jgi:hypothetical protein
MKVGTVMENELDKPGETGIELYRLPSDIVLDTTRATKVSFGDISLLGASFASMTDSFRTMTVFEDVSGQDLYRCINETAKGLKQSGDGVLVGYTKEGKLAKFANADTGTLTATIPVDPMTVAIAIAMTEVNRKLDAIADLQNDMYEYMTMRDKAKLRGSLEYLQSIAETYRFNWDNEAYKTAQLQKAVDIKQESLQSVIAIRSLIEKSLGHSNLVEVRSAAEKDLGELLDLLKDYQLSLHLFSFSSFAEVLLLGNFDHDYLEKIATDIREKALHYRELYTACFDAVERRTESSVESKLLGGVSKLGKGLSNVVAKTPVGDRTQIDEALGEAGERLGSFNAKKNADLKNRLIEVKDPGVVPFAESIESLAEVFDGDTELLTDGESFYLFPAGN